MESTEDPATSHLEEETILRCIKGGGRMDSQISRAEEAEETLDEERS